MNLVKLKITFIFIILLSVFCFTDSKTITFPSKDNLLITADLYMPLPDTAPFIILFHQAGWSRGEYVNIAPKLNKMGFNCLAIDQRSGGQINGVLNETAARAKKNNLGVAYMDAYIDLESTLLYVQKNITKNRVIVWGSSYSSALVFKLAAKYPVKINGLLAFAPGEYFQKTTGNARYITGFASRIKCPVFITSAKKEFPNWKGIFTAVKGVKSSFIPDTAGNHGSRALWKVFKDSKYYWEAVTLFLKENFFKK